MPTKTILIVNDDPIVLRVTGNLLQRAGFTVLRATNGFDAMVIGRANRPDLIVSDILMPSLDGFELCRWIRGDVLLANVPVILCSNLDPTREDLATTKAVGANAFVPMSYDLSELIKEIWRLIG